MRCSFSQEVLEDEKYIKEKRNFTALTNDIQEKLGNSHAVPKFRPLLRLDIAEK